MTSENIEKMSEFHGMGLETARLLLEAGSDSRDQHGTYSEYILEYIKVISSLFSDTLETTETVGWLMCARRNSLPLCAKFVKLLLMYEGKTTTKISKGKLEILKLVGNLVTNHLAIRLMSIDSYNSVGPTG